jgi:hypothetical protein
MEPEVKQEINPPEYTAEPVSVEVTPTQDSGILIKSSPANQSSEQWRQIGEKISEFLADLPDYLSDFFGEYKRPIVTVGLIIAAFIAVKLLLAILGAINDVPLLAPLFELVGIGYAAWFVYRYLWKAENRRELATDFNSLKAQVLGTIDKIDLD